MSALFISHSSRDSAVAMELVEWLQQRSFRSLFLDFDPQLGIPAGRQWEQELYRQLRTCQAVIVLCSEHSMESDWCFVEMTHARALGKFIFPLRIAPCALRPTLAELQLVDAVTDRPGAYERLLSGLQAAGLDAAALWDGSRPPYPGLMAFQEGDAAVFFGRDAEIRAALDAITRLRRFADSRLLLCVGASGSGKSSLIRAGVLPRLRQAADSWLCLPPLRPLKRPIDELALAMTHGVGEGDRTANWKSLAQRLRAIAQAEPPPVADLLRDLRQQAGRREATIVVIVDQLEEALVASEEARGFLRLLRAFATEPDSQALVLCTLRSDFMGTLQTHPEAQHLIYETLTLGPLSSDGLVEVIVGPARVADVQLAPGLTDMLRADTQAEDGLPLLAFALRELWDLEGTQGRFTIQTYRETLGGLSGSVARAAEAVLQSEPITAAQEDALRLAFLAMARIGESGQYLRQAARWDRLPSVIHPLLERFVAAHLLVARSENNERRLEVAHEALFRVWARARAWLDADRENLRLRDGLRQAAREWQARNRIPELLVHRGARLEAIEALAREPRFALDEIELAYLNAGVQLRQDEQQARDRQAAARRRQLRLTLAGLSIALVVVTTLMVWAGVERREAQARLANLHWVNAVNERDRNHNHLKSMHHFMQAAALAADVADARNAHLAGALLAGSLRLGAVLEPREPTSLAAFADDGIVTWSLSGSAQRWDARTGQERAAALLQGSARRATPSPGGQWMVLQFADDVVEVLDTRSGQRAAVLSDAVGLPEFSTDEARWALRDSKGRVHVWERGRDLPLATLASAGRIRGFVLSGDGTRILAWDERRTVSAWSAGSGELLARIELGSELRGAAFRADGQQAVVWSKDAPASLWTLGAAALLELVPDGRGANEVNPNFMGAAFLADNARLLTWNYGGEGKARLWDLHTGAHLLTGEQVEQVAHAKAIRNARFSRDAALVLTWGEDATARVWRVRDGKPMSVLRHAGDVRGAAFSPDQTRVVTWSDRTARVWDPLDDEALSLPLLHEGAVEGAAFAADASSVLTWDRRTTRVWRLQASAERRVVSLEHDQTVLAAYLGAAAEGLTLTSDGTLHRFLNGAARHLPLESASRLTGAVFDADGARLLAWSAEHAVRLWSSADGKALTPPLRHDSSGFGIRGALLGKDASRIVSWGDDGTVRLWDNPSGRLLALLRHSGAVDGVHLDPGANRVLTWSDDQIVRLWDAASQKIMVTLPTFDEGVRGAALMSNGSRILTWDAQGMLRLWDARDGKAIGHFSHAPGTPVRGAAVSRDQRRVLAWDPQTVVIWSVRDDGAAQDLVRWSVPGVRHAAFNADESRVLTAGEDGRVRLWESRRGYPLSMPFALGSEVLGVVPSVDEGSLLAWTDALARVWNVRPTPDEPLAQAGRGVQLRSGTQLDRLGDLELVPAKLWLEMSRKTHAGPP